jgi:ammonia channel protein AmtB
MIYMTLRYDFNGGGIMNTRGTAFMIVATAMVMLMTPALALFYGGMVRSKNVLSTIMQSFIILKSIDIIIGLRVDVEDEVQGLDIS